MRVGAWFGHLAIAGVLLSSSGCRSTTPSAPTSAPATPAPTDAAVVTQPAITSPPASSSATSVPSTSVGSTDQALDTSVVEDAFITFFDGANPDVEAKIGVLERGEELRSMLVDAAADPQFMQLSTVVTSVERLDDAECAAVGEHAPCALVIHDLFVGGLPAMVDLHSYAVRLGTAWKVSASSWCAIVAIGGASCPQLDSTT